VATTAGGYIVGGRVETKAVPRAKRRLIDARTGHALEILGHAIEYLSDEYVHEARQLSADDPQVEAIQILMAINREMYYACPVAPTFRERLRALLWFTGQ
jgi:hypothetical protein